MSEQITIRVRYSCPDCGFIDRPVDVPARRTDQGVLAWMKELENALGQDHWRAARPICRADSLKDVKIPIDGADIIGGPAKQ